MLKCCYTLLVNSHQKNVLRREQISTSACVSMIGACMLGETFVDINPKSGTTAVTALV